jgi:hypothetical protein
VLDGDSDRSASFLTALPPGARAGQKTSDPAVWASWQRAAIDAQLRFALAPVAVTDLLTGITWRRACSAPACTSAAIPWADQWIAGPRPDDAGQRRRDPGWGGGRILLIEDSRTYTSAADNTGPSPRWPCGRPMVMAVVSLADVLSSPRRARTPLMRRRPVAGAPRWRRGTSCCTTAGSGWRFALDVSSTPALPAIDTQNGCSLPPRTRQPDHVPHPYQSAFFADASALF